MKVASGLNITIISKGYHLYQRLKLSIAPVISILPTKMARATTSSAASMPAQSIRSTEPMDQSYGALEAVKATSRCSTGTS